MGSNSNSRAVTVELIFINELSGGEHRDVGRTTAMCCTFVWAFIACVVVTCEHVSMLRVGGRLHLAGTFWPPLPSVLPTTSLHTASSLCLTNSLYCVAQQPATYSSPSDILFSFSHWLALYIPATTTPLSTHIHCMLAHHLLLAGQARLPVPFSISRAVGTRCDTPFCRTYRFCAHHAPNRA